ncbi:MAG: hypothetical protein WBF21_19715 [Steroidobacteraceae bacterium]
MNGISHSGADSLGRALVDHQEAMRRGAVEKYLLNEIPEPEREEFERHFFDCQECAEEMRTTAAFLAEAKMELRRSHARHPVRAAPKKPWFEILFRPAIAVPVFVLLLVIVGYQNLMVRSLFADSGTQLKYPQILTALSLQGGGNRDGLVPIATIDKDQPLLLSLDNPTAERFESYAAILVASSGAVVWRLPVSAVEAKGTVVISVPSGALAPGNYRLLLQGRADAGQVPVDLASYRFTLKGSD